MDRGHYRESSNLPDGSSLLLPGHCGRPLFARPLDSNTTSEPGAIAGAKVTACQVKDRSWRATGNVSLVGFLPPTTTMPGEVPGRELVLGDPSCGAEREMLGG